MEDRKKLAEELAAYRPDEKFPDDILGLRCCQLALQALEGGSYGVGALLFNENGEILAEAGNRVFRDGLQSASHAEMLVMDTFERSRPKPRDRSGLSLMASLEPCPMCLTRLMISGVGRVIYLAGDVDGGMVHRLDKMPPVWQNLAQLQEQGRAEVSPKLAELAARLAAAELAGLRRKLLDNIRG